MTDGALFSDADVRAMRKVALLGSTVAASLFPGGDAVGQQVQLRSVPFTVVGVLASKGQTAIGSDQDDVVIVPYTTAQSRLSGWARVQQTFLDPAVAVQAWPRVFDGLLLNIRVLIFSAIGVLIVSILLATLRTLRGPIFFPLRALAAGYTDLFRGMPLLIVLYLVGFGLPGVICAKR